MQSYGVNKLQQEARRQKEQLKNIDPGNPNWQFLTMIRDYQSQIDFRPLKMSDQVNNCLVPLVVHHSTVFFGPHHQNITFTRLSTQEKSRMCL